MQAPRASTIVLRTAGWLAALAFWFGAPIAAQTPPLATEPVYWGRQELLIPYRFAGAANTAAEVILYYSSDQGRSWRVAGSAAPHVQSFRFQAPGDGEHWFAVRTYDRGGVATPPGPLGPEMRVVVDTAAPSIERLAAQISGGVLTVELAATDPGGFSATQPAYLYAQPSGQPGWTPVPITSTQPSADGRTLQLVGQWRPPTSATRVEVRATVEDRAGNRIERSAFAEAGQQLAGQVPGFSGGWPAASSAGAAPSGASPSDPFAEAERRFAALSPATTSAPAAPSAPASTTPWPAESPKSRPLVAGSVGPGNNSSPFNSASFGSSPLDPFEGRKSPRPSFDTTAPGRMVNSSEFEFDYELDHTGRWGVAKVELWGTNNGGRSWRRFAVDADRESPIHVTTPGEGTYGFRLLVESIGGLESPTPRPGDEPEAVVGVDLTKPQVLLGDVRQGVGYFADQLVIEWRAEDEHLSERPIDLFYSNHDTGPWIPVATNLPNNGRHSWRLQRHLPRRVFLRVEARDEAGNVAAVTSPEAIEIDVSVASGSLKSVRPSGY